MPISSYAQRICVRCWMWKKYEMHAYSLLITIWVIYMYIPLVMPYDITRTFLWMHDSHVKTAGGSFKQLEKFKFANVFYGIPTFQPTDYMYIVFCHMHWYFLCTQSCCQYKTSTIVNILPICHFIEIFTKTILWIIWLSRTYNISWIYIGSYSKTLPAACIVALMIQNFPHGWCGDKVAGFFIYSYCISTLDMDNGQTSLLLSNNYVLSKCSCVPL